MFGINYLQLSFLYSSLCTSLVTSMYNPACNKAFEAGMNQSGVTQQYSLLTSTSQDKITATATKGLEDTTGKDAATYLVGAGIFAFRAERAYKAKAIDFKIPPKYTFGVVDSMSVKAGIESSSFNLGWNF